MCKFTFEERNLFEKAFFSEPNEGQIRVVIKPVNVSHSDLTEALWVNTTHTLHDKNQSQLVWIYQKYTFSFQVIKASITDG